MVLENVKWLLRAQQYGTPFSRQCADALCLAHRLSYFFVFCLDVDLRGAFIVNSKEYIIRDKLANQLELIDSRLKLVSTEHSVKLEDGETAFIDILAKDEFGCYTIIEIKKSAQTSRSAVQQLYKYAGFLKLTRRLENFQIRCVIVSTVWNELMIPFSEFKHFSDYDSQGYAIELKSNGEIALTKVDAKFEAGDSQPIGNYIFFEFGSNVVRDNTQLAFEKVLDSIPSLNCVIVTADYSGDDTRVVHPYGFAWISFTGNIESLQSEVLRLSAASNDIFDSAQFFDPEGIRESWETSDPETVVRSLILREYVRIANGDGEYGCFALHSLNNTLAQWKTSHLKGYGPMFRGDFFDQRELIEMSCGFVGSHPYNFMASTTPSRPHHFAMIRDRLDNFLSTNTRWRIAMNVIFSDLDERDVLRINIFNPLNLFGLLNDLYEKGSSKRISQATIEREMEDGTKIVYFGGLYWTSELPVLSVREAIARSYPNELYFFARSVNHKLNDHDVKLSDVFGLTYEFFRIRSDIQEIFRHDDGLGYWEKCESVRTVQDFVEVHDQLIVEVGEFFQSSSFVQRVDLPPLLKNPPNSVQ